MNPHFFVGQSSNSSALYWDIMRIRDNIIISLSACVHVLTCHAVCTVVMRAGSSSDKE